MTSTTETKHLNKSVNYFQPEFSHIYIEEEALKWDRTEEALSSFPSAERIPITDYKQIFNRPNQNIFSQHNSKKLILAVKKNPFLYRGSDILQDTQYQNIYYTTPLINCVYHCDYCFLHGMYPSANLVAFVNDSDFYNAVDEGIMGRKFKSQPLLLSIAYNNDLLAFENKVSYCKNWIEYAKNKNNLLIEIRTKCANVNSIKKIASNPNILFAWTLTPNEVRRRYEKFTPSLEKRLDALEIIISKGWKVRICVDPVLYVNDWESIYNSLFDKLFSRIKHEQISDMVIGVFRMNKNYFNRIRAQKPNSGLYYQNWDQSDNIIESSESVQSVMYDKIEEMINKYIPLEKVYFWKNAS